MPSADACTGALHWLPLVQLHHPVLCRYGCPFSPRVSCLTVLEPGVCGHMNLHCPHLRVPLPHLLWPHLWQQQQPPPETGKEPPRRRLGLAFKSLENRITALGGGNHILSSCTVSCTASLKFAGPLFGLHVDGRQVYVPNTSYGTHLEALEAGVGEGRTARHGNSQVEPRTHQWVRR